LSGDVTEFWRRWHITLSTWLRDYLYIPLGGNRRGAVRTYLNLVLTMLLGGLWHGASWNFVLWGALHGGALALHRAYRGMRGGDGAVPYAVAAPLTFLFVALCWVPFRCTSFAMTLTVFTRLFTLDSGGATWLPTLLIPALALVIVGHALGRLFEREAAGHDAPRLANVLSWFDARLLTDPVSGFYVRFGIRTIPGAFLMTFWLLALFFLAPLNTTPFIYFRF
jgi:alginate O-acetyltransferase complex protein AlgI